MEKSTFKKAEFLLRQIDFLESLLKSNLINHGFIMIKTTNYLPVEIFPDIKPLWDEMNGNILENIKVTFAKDLSKKFTDKKKELEKQFKAL